MRILSNLAQSLLGLTPSQARWLELFLGNVVPLLGVWFLGWTLFPLLLLYWFENAIVGFFNLLKLATCRSESGFLARVGTMVFFAIHYGFFWYAHGIAVIASFSHHGGPEQAYSLIGLYGLGLGLCLLYISHGFSLFQDYYGQEQHRFMKLEDLLFQPYQRVFILHLFLFVGAWVLDAAGVTTLSLSLLLLIKVGMEYVALRSLHQRGEQIRRREKRRAKRARKRARRKAAAV